MRTFTQTVTTSTKMYTGAGRQFVLMNCDSGCNVTFLRRNSIIASATNVLGGYSTRYDEPFDAAVIEVSSGSEEITVGVSMDYGSYTRLQGSVTTTQNVPTTYTALTDVTVGAASTAKIADANNDRVELHIMCDYSCRLGDVTTKPTATKGVLLPGMVNMVLNSAGEIWAYNPNGSSATFYLSALEV